MKRKDFFYALNGWRFIFSLLIVWHHLPDIWKDRTLGYDFGNTIVLFFFILSGFLLTLGYKDKFLKGQITYKDFVIKRIETIFPLQWLMTSLFVLFGINIVTYWAIPFHLTLSQSLIPLWDINFMVNTPSWFLSSIFICYLLAPPSLILAAKGRERFVVPYLIIVIIWNLFIIFLPSHVGTRWLCYINPFSRFIDFSAGTMLALYWNEIKSIFSKLLKNKALATCFEVAIICIIFYWVTNKSAIRLNDFTVIRYPTIFFFIIIFAISSGQISSLLGSRLCNRLGDLSIAIYMCHEFILYFTQQIEIGSNNINIFITYALTLLASYLLVHYYCPFMSKFLRKACTRKKE